MWRGWRRQGQVRAERRDKASPPCMPSRHGASAARMCAHWVLCLGSAQPNSVHSVAAVHLQGACAGCVCSVRAQGASFTISKPPRQHVTTSVVLVMNSLLGGDAMERYMLAGDTTMDADVRKGKVHARRYTLGQAGKHKSLGQAGMHKSLGASRHAQEPGGK
eukprot:75816-Chlamydomonas_euryale.AAC.1